MSDLWHELLHLTWKESVEKADKLQDTFECPSDVIASGLAFIIGSQRLEVTEEDCVACFSSMLEAWKVAGGRFSK